MGKTSIAWTEHTWNPTRGCSRVSEGCRNCYAERTAARGLPGMKSPTTGEPFAIMTPSGPRWTGKVELIESMLDIPLRRKKPTTYFVNSMSDLLHESLSVDQIAFMWATMLEAYWHTFQILTKRAARLPEVLDAIRGRMGMVWNTIRNGVFQWPLPNVHLGVSVEDRPNLVRIEHLRKTPAAVRFVSFEPLLEDLGQINLRGIDLAIWGGESGPGARSCDLAWIRNGMKQARRDDCRNFVKQLGAYVIDRNDAGFDGDTPTSWPMDTKFFELFGSNQGEPVRVRLKDRKGGDPAEWPLDLRVRMQAGDAWGGEQ